MNNFPERELLLEGVARGRQSSRWEVITGGNPTGMSYLFYYTEQNTKGGELQTPEISDKYSSSALLN